MVSSSLAIVVGLSAVLSGQPGLMAQQAPELSYVIERVAADQEPETGEPSAITIWLSRPIDTAVGDVLAPDPVEIRPLEGQGSPFRPTFRRDGETLFSAEVTFERPGQWQLVLYPDVPDAQRASLPIGVPRELTLSVTSPPAGWLGPVLLLVMAAGLFAFALTGRKRTGPPKKKLPPTTGGDTWWTGG